MTETTLETAIKWQDNYIPEPNSGCWIWLGETFAGYGKIRKNRHQSRFAHRMFYALHKGHVPSDLFVCHHCDNKVCVNPDHLFLGTRQDNAQDMIKKGLWPKRFGEAAPNVRLTRAQVRAIRSATGRQRDVALQFGVHQSAVSRIKNKVRWPDGNTSDG